jgi:phosphohistidine swiveling domain-containing protein
MRHKGKFPVALVSWGGQRPTWCEDRRGNWIHGEGPTYHPQSPSDTVIERREVDDDEWISLLDAADEADWKAELARVRKGVMEQCGGEMIDLRDIDGNVVASVPKAPFICYALNRTSLRHLMPPWRCVSDSDMKMTNDCRYHSDWYYGGGFDNVNGRYPRGSQVHKAAEQTAWEIQREYGEFKSLVIVSGATVTGVVGENIAVLPNLSMDHYETACRASAIITEAGGALVHMAVVLREQGVPIVLVPDARRRYPKGTSLIVDAEHGDVRIIDAASEWSDVG